MTAWPTESEVKAMFPRKEGFGDDVTLAAIAQLPEVRALVEVVRVQADLLEAGTAGHRGVIIGNRLTAALAAFTEVKP